MDRDRSPIRDRGPSANHIRDRTSLNELTKTNVSTPFSTQPSFNSDESLPTTQPEPHQNHLAISSTISSLTDSFTTAPNDTLENQKKNTEKNENQKKQTEKNENQKKIAISELVRPIRLANINEPSKVHSTLNLTASQKATTLPTNNKQTNLLTNTTQTPNTTQFTINTTTQNTTTTTKNDPTKITSTHPEIELTPISQHNSNITHAATEQQSRHAIDSQQTVNTSNHKGNTTSHTHPNTTFATVPLLSPSPNNSYPPASLPAKGSWASVAGAGQVTNPRTGATQPEDPIYSAMKTPVPYSLKSQITNYRNQQQKTTVSSVDGKPINLEHLKSCLRQLDYKVRSTPELATRVVDYNNYLMDTFQDSHGIYHQTIVPEPTFNEDDPKITNDCCKLFTIMLTEHFKSQYDYNLHLPSTQPNERLVIIQATYPSLAYPDRRNIYNKHLQEYGKLVLSHTDDIGDHTTKPYYNTFFVLNYTSDSLPPSTVSNRTRATKSYTKIRLTLRTQMLHCVYCKSINHEIEKCPLVPRCLQCPMDKHHRPQEHNYLSCPYNDIEEKMNEIQNLSSTTIQNALKTKHALKQIPQALILHPNFPKESLTEEQYNQFITSAKKTISKQKAIAEIIKNTKPSQETKENVTLEEWMVAKTTRRRGPSQNYNSQNTSSNIKKYNKNTNSFAILNNETVEEPHTTYEGSSQDKITTEQEQSTTENKKEKQSLEDDKQEQSSTEDDLSSDNGDLHGEEIDDLHFKEMDNITKEDSKKINNTISHNENTNEIPDTQLTNNSETQILQDSQVPITINKTQIDDDSEMNDGQPTSDEEDAYIRNC